MNNKKLLSIALVILVLLIIALIFYFTLGGSDPVQFQLTKAARHEIRLVISTNGVIESTDSTDIYAPIDAFVTSIPVEEGAEIRQGRLLMQLNSEQIRSALAEANAALLSARRQAKTVSSGPPREEIAAVDASIAESRLQLEQSEKDLALEESLYAKGAASRMAVETLKKQRDLFQLRVDGLNRRKQDLLARYSEEEKRWEQDRVEELTKEVAVLKRQLNSETLLAPLSGIVFSLSVKPGSFVSKGQLLAQIYRPGDIRVRAYVDEPELARIQKGQPVRIEWDGMPDKYWDGVVEKPAEQVVKLNMRSVGNILCSISGSPRELIPNLNVGVEIVTASKNDVLVVPKSAVFRHGGNPSVLFFDGKRTTVKPVTMGIATSEEIEILNGIHEGDTIVLNPADAKTNP